MSSVDVRLPTEDDPVTLLEGDCLDVLPLLPAGAVDAVVTDPPYGLEFMGKEWDKLAGDWNKGDPAKAGHHTGGLERWTIKRPRYHAGVAAQAWHQQWAEAVLRVLKPGGYLLAFGSPRTYHRLTCAVEDAGFEVRDCLMFLHAQGFPKGKGCLKPAYEPILLARRPGPKVLPLGVDECRVPIVGDVGNWEGKQISRPGVNGTMGENWQQGYRTEQHPAGRWPANVVLSDDPEVLEAFAVFGEGRARGNVAPTKSGIGMFHPHNGEQTTFGGDAGTAARFFFCAKASREERNAGCDGLPEKCSHSHEYHNPETTDLSAGKVNARLLTRPQANSHPTVKPLSLCRWLVKLVCPPGGVVLDPFLGSGTTAVACLHEHRLCVGVEREPDYLTIARRRVALPLDPGPLFATTAPPPEPTLFDLEATP